MSLKDVTVRVYDNAQFQSVSNIVNKTKEEVIMNRELLKELELSDDQIEKVMSEHGKTIQEYKNKVTDKDTQLKSLEEEKDTLSKQVTTLEKKANDVSKLEEENNKLQEEIKDYKIQVSTNELDKRILKEISKDAHDPDDIFHFLDKDKFEEDENGEITNFHEVLQDLRDNKAYLFSSSNSNEGDGSTDDNEKPPANSNYKTGGQSGNNEQKVDYAKKGKDLANQLFEK